jgi:hypothetical protein
VAGAITGPLAMLSGYLKVGRTFGVSSISKLALSNEKLESRPRRRTSFVYVPCPSLEEPNRYHLCRHCVQLEFLVEKVMAVHEIVSRLSAIFWDTSNKRGDLRDTHHYNSFESSHRGLKYVSQGRTMLYEREGLGERS